MGVSGSGKTTIGEMVAEDLSIAFYDGDSFHSKENIAKMSAGHPLNDDDRAGWLSNINEFVVDQLQNHSVVVACSALKESYRHVLNHNISEEDRIWIYLDCDFHLIRQRMEARSHFMPPSLLQSQFDTLEIPSADLRIDMSQSLDTIHKTLRSFLQSISL